MSTQMEVLAKQIADSVESLKRDNKSPEEEAQHRAVIAKSAHALAHLTKTPIEHLMDRFVIYTDRSRFYKSGSIGGGLMSYG